MIHAISSDQALQEIDDLLEELTRLTRSVSSPRAFHAELLDRAVRALAASGGAFWTPDAGGLLQPEVRVDPAGTQLVDRLRACAGHAELLEAVLRVGEPRLVLPGSAAGSDGRTANPTDQLLLVCPVVVESSPTPIGVLEVAQRSGGSPATQQGYLRLVAALCDLAADFHQQRLLRTWQDRAARAGSTEQFAERVHATLETTAVAAAIANEGRRLVQCDRVSVAVLPRGSCRLVAVSGQEQIDRRANIVRRLESLTKAVVSAGEPFWHGERTGPLPPQISGPLHAYLDEAHPQVLAILPLPVAAGDVRGDEPAPSGALIVERFAGPVVDDPFRERVAWVARQGGLALANALEHERLPFFSLLHALQKTRWLTRARQLPRTLLALLLLAAAALGLIFIPADFDVSGRGALQPELRREIFAGGDGIVAEVRVDHGSPCKPGETLVVLTRSQLDFEMSRVLGEVQTARQRLAGVQAARLELTPQTAADREKYNRLSADEEELKELLTNLAQQQGVLRLQQEELQAKSPIDGQVITWNVRELLEARPVQRGQALLTVADLAGPWVLEVEVPDDHISHILAARQEQGPELPVSFMLATAPGATYTGQVEKVGLATELRPGEAAHVLVTVRFDRNQVPQLRPGATVVPRIHCGRRALGYVWFHGLIEAVQKHVLF